MPDRTFFGVVLHSLGYPVGCLSVAETWLCKLFAGIRHLFAPKLFRTVLTLQHLGTPTPEPVPKPFRTVPNRSNLESQTLDKTEHDEMVFETSKRFLRWYASETETLC